MQSVCDQIEQTYRKRSSFVREPLCQVSFEQIAQDSEREKTGKSGTEY